MLTDNYTKLIDFNGSNGRMPVYSKLRKVISVGIPDNADIASVLVSPNPVTDVLKITFGSRPPGNIRYSVVDMSGNRILQGVLTGTGPFLIRTGALSSGSYLLYLSYDNTSLTKKFTVRK